MKERIYKHIGMTIIGAIIWVVTLGLFIINKLELLPNAHEMSMMEVVAFMMLGYIFYHWASLRSSVG
jgi:hypothetical protein